jgi:hypothetical protein
MKIPQFILSTTLATLAVLVLTPPPPTAAQSFSQLLNHAKIISNSGHHQFQEPIIRASELVENKLQNAYWIDFHDQFDQHTQFLQLVATHPGITLRHEFWDSINSVSVSVRDEAVLKEILNQIAGVKLIEPVVCLTDWPSRRFIRSVTRELAEANSKTPPFSSYITSADHT